jgi:hypothetical protein
MNPYESLMPGNDLLGTIPIELADVEVRNRSEGLPSWQVHANSLTISANRSTISANGLTNGVFYKNSSPILLFAANHVESDAAQFYLPPRIVIDGGVDLWAKQSKSMLPVAIHVSTPTVTWDSSAATASCPSAVAFSVGAFGSGTATGVNIDTQHKSIQFGQMSADSSLRFVDDPSTLAQSAPISSPDMSKASPNADELTYTASDGYWDENNQILTVRGPITFHQGKAQVDMTGAVFDEKTNIATSSSPIKFTDEDTSVTGDHGSINFTTHIAILSGHITMIVLPKPEDQVKEQGAKKPTTILCDQVNYDYKVKKAHTAGEVTIKQPGRTVTSDDGQYDVVAKIIDLTGDVIGKSTDGKKITAPHAQISVDPKDEWMRLDGPITGIEPVPSQDNPLSSNNVSAPTHKSVQQISPADTSGQKFPTN